jgi:MoaA/NifB/PqqE/SkfB family radical SAM enzyme
MDRGEALDLIGLLAGLRPPVLLMSGGEPLAHPDFFLYIKEASSAGLRVSVSTNGVLIGEREAAEMAASGVSYAGVSLDGVGGVNDAFRGVGGAFRKAVNGIEALASAGCRVGMRITLARPLLPYLEPLLDLAISLPVSRVCFYHFAPVGRGALDPGLTPCRDDERRAVARIIRWADDAARSRSGRTAEILTVGDASDGVLVYEYLLSRDHARAEAARDLLARQASRHAAGILSVRWDGTLFSNQFSWDRPLGDWRGLAGLRPQGEAGMFRPAPPSCRASCRWKDICPGNEGRRCLAAPDGADAR